MARNEHIRVGGELGTMERIVRTVSRVMAILAAMSIFLLMLAIVVDVSVRSFTNASLPGMVEIAESSLIVAVFFGLAWAGVEGQHVAVTLLSDRLGAKVNHVFDFIVWSLVSLTMLWLVWATTDRAVSATQSHEVRFGLLEWPLYPLRWVIVVGFAALLLVAVTNLFRVLRGESPFLAVNDDAAPFAVRATLDSPPESK